MPVPGRDNGGQWAASSPAADRGSMTDVMAHELVVGCLVRLALIAEGDTAAQVLSVLERERGRARVRERLGRGAVGPMEEVVAKVGTGSRRVSMLYDVCVCRVWWERGAALSFVFCASVLSPLVYRRSMALVAHR